MDSVHHIWCPLSSQEFQDLPDGAETTLTKELIEQAKLSLASRNYDNEVMKPLRDNISESSRQVEALQQEVQVKSDALAEMDRQMSYLRQQTSSQLLDRYQQNYRFGGSEGGL